MCPSPFTSSFRANQSICLSVIFPSPFTESSASLTYDNGIEPSFSGRAASAAKVPASTVCFNKSFKRITRSASSSGNDARSLPLSLPTAAEKLPCSPPCFFRTRSFNACIVVSSEEPGLSSSVATTSTLRCGSLAF